MKKKLLITGVSGLLGSNLAYCLRDRYEICGLYHSHEIEMNGVSTRKCDLTMLSEVQAIVNDFSPDIVVHCAALADVDKCEEDPDLAYRSNVLATKNIVASLNDKCKLVYISTDLVYEGSKGNYSEEDETGPQNVYAQTKLQGEAEALKKSNALVLRTNIFGWSLFERESVGVWVINSLEAGKKIKGFTDAIFSSIYTFDFAEILAEVIEKKLEGIYNLGSSTSLSKYDFAVLIAKKLNFNSDLIEPVSIDSFNFKAQRSKDISLDVSKLQAAINAEMVPFEGLLNHFIDDFKKNIVKEFKFFSEIKGSL